VAAVGALIRDYTGSGIAAVSIAGIVQRFGPDRYDYLVGSVKEAALSISRQMGYVGNLVERACPPEVGQAAEVGRSEGGTA
jgi:hypothetical protein